eukprot:TRINITY_DN7433_c0_g1_i1.p1 TRINITY_DN7433_c0_g1~~TRINITY_DN7433_c0_g1_i1.p1  ORF type:complete len:432 (-),score=87.93 TRINITY_DN7433_c0_g1_i1:37-1293(-)
MHHQMQHPMMYDPRLHQDMWNMWPYQWPNSQVQQLHPQFMYQSPPPPPPAPPQQPPLSRQRQTGTTRGGIQSFYSQQAGEYWGGEYWGGEDWGEEDWGSYGHDGRVSATPASSSTTGADGRIWRRGQGNGSQQSQHMQQKVHHNSRRWTGSGSGAAGEKTWVAAAMDGAATQGSPSTCSGSNSKGSKGKGRGKSHAGSDNNQPRLVRISKTLTQLLRHKAVELEMPIRSDGYCPLDQVIGQQWLQELDCTREDVDEVVTTSDKKRFEIKVIDGVLMIRAVQGHSMKVIDDDELLQRLEAGSADLPRDCVHGTYRKHLDSILRHGLLAGGGQGQSFRNHVHFAPFAPGDKRVISGMRYDCEIAIWVDVEQAIKDGVPFYKSTNAVILSPGDEGVIHKKYFKRIRDLKDKQDIPKSSWQK